MIADDDEVEVDDEAHAAFLRAVASTDDLPPPDDDLRPGDRLDRFTIGERLGAGSMGVVYAATDPRLERSVAIKVMRRTSEPARARFIREARAAAAITHPNLVVVHEIGEAAGRAFLVMERVHGRTLRGVFPERRVALRIARAIARGLAAVHAAGVVHRDLKPDNVMLLEDGTVKLLDFGIARFAAGSADPQPMTGTGMVIGTPSYMSPEQASGGDVDARSDIYSFGVLAYELFTGVRPAAATRPRIAPGLDRVVARCLAAGAADRFATGVELSDALDGITLRSRRAVPAIVLAGLAGMLAIGAVLHHPTPRPRPLMALPEIETSSDAARAAYRGAFQALHDSQLQTALRGFGAAIELDPSFAAAHLRLALAGRGFLEPDVVRRSFELAVRHRDRLDARDRALVDASEPAVLRSPYDHAETERRMVALVDNDPDDAELTYWLAFAHSELGEHAKVLADADRLLAVEPLAPYALTARSVALFYLGDLNGARESAIECRQLAPTRGACMLELERILDHRGDCDELEALLRAWMIASPDEPRARNDLATLLLATGRPMPAIRELLEQRRARLPEADRATAMLEDEVGLARETGDFTHADRLLATMSATDVAGDRIAIALETGRTGDAAALARDFLARVEANPPPHGSTDFDLFTDPTGEALAAVALATPSRELDAKRAAWRQALGAHASGTYARQVWAAAYAWPALSVADARDAVAALPSELPTTYWFADVHGRIGRVFALADRPRDALPYLERATRRCMHRDPRDQLALGEVYAKLGDRSAACVAFRDVVARWGHATPRSVTADAARGRIDAVCR